MRRLFFAFTALLLFAVPAVARADDASKHAKVRELFQLTSMQNRVDQIRASALAQARSIAAQQFASIGVSEQDKGIDTYYDKLDALVAARYNWTRLESEYEKIYASLYTEDELDGILTFYKSPVGQTFLAKTPEATRQVLQLSKEQFEALTPQIEALTEDFAVHLKAQPAPKK